MESKRRLRNKDVKNGNSRRAFEDLTASINVPLPSIGAVKKRKEKHVEKSSTSEDQGSSQKDINKKTDCLNPNKGVILKIGESQRSTRKKSISDLCKEEIKDILRPKPKKKSVAGPKSASYAQQNVKFQFNVYETQKSQTVEDSEEISQDNAKRLKKTNSFSQLSHMDKENTENKPKNILLMEREWEARRNSRHLKVLEKEDHVDTKICNMLSETIKPKVVEKNSNLEISRSTLKADLSAPKNLLEENFKEMPLESSDALNVVENFNAPKQRKPKIARRDSRKKENSDVLYSYIFIEDYLKDIIENAKIQEKKILLAKTFFSAEDAIYRKEVIDFLFYIQKELQISDDNIYLTVSLLDQVIARAWISQHAYKVVTLACLWISNKLNGDCQNVVSVDDLVKLSDINDCEKKLVKMERKILRLVDFRIPSLEPTTFIHYFLKMMNLDHISDTYFMVYFILDHIVCLPEYSSWLLSLVAAASILLAFDVVHEELLEKAKNFFKENLTPLELLECKTIQIMVRSQLKSNKNPVILNKYKNFIH